MCFCVFSLSLLVHDRAQMPVLPHLSRSISNILSKLAVKTAEFGIYILCIQEIFNVYLSISGSLDYDKFGLLHRSHLGRRSLLWLVSQGLQRFD